MLVIHVNASEYYDEERNLFIETPAATLKLEHSLISLSKWEEKWKTPFLGRREHTDEELLDYIRCMTLNDVDPRVYQYLSVSNLDTINAYMNDSHTATTIKRSKKTGPSREMITAELIYYWMISLNIPLEFENRNLNKLLTLIEVCNIKNTPPKKMTKSEMYNRNREINEANKKFFASKG